MDLVGREGCALTQSGIVGKTFFGNETGLACGDICEEGDDIKTDHDVAGPEIEILDVLYELVRVGYMMRGVAHQGLEDFCEVLSSVVGGASP